MSWGVGVTAGLLVACSLASGQASAQEPQLFSGIAAFYDKDYDDIVASGGTYDPKKFTAAHRTLPFGTRVLVIDPQTRRSVEVVINDRGPFNKGRVLDLSYAAAKALQMIDRGVIHVTVAVQLPMTFTMAATTPAR